MNEDEYVRPVVCELKTRTKEATIEAELSYIRDSDLNAARDVTTLHGFRQLNDDQLLRIAGLKRL